MMARHGSSAPLLAWLYAGLIIYASLSPFTGWQLPSGLSPSDFALLPWPHLWTGFDVGSNLLGYMPLGALVFGALIRSGWRTWTAVSMALILGTLLSFLMESLQYFLPMRVSSSLDWVLNVAGTLIGLLMALTIHLLGGVDRWQVLRDRWLVEPSAGGLALLLLWPVGLLFPTPVPLGLGQVLVRLQDFAARAVQGTSLARWGDGWLDVSIATAPLSQSSEWLAIVLGLFAPCLVAFGIVRPGWRRAVVVPGAAGIGLVATTLSTALNFGPQHALAWVTPPAPSALIFAVVITLLLVTIPHRVAAGLGLVVLTGLIALVAQAPVDPYYAESLLGWEQGRFIRFHGAAQWVGWIWPYAALLYLLARVSERSDSRKSETP